MPKNTNVIFESSLEQEKKTKSPNPRSNKQTTNITITWYHQWCILHSNLQQHLHNYRLIQRHLLKSKQQLGHHIVPEKCTRIPLLPNEPKIIEPNRISNRTPKILVKNQCLDKYTYIVCSRCCSCSSSCSSSSSGCCVRVAISTSCLAICDHIWTSTFPFAFFLSTFCWSPNVLTCFSETDKTNQEGQ